MSRSEDFDSEFWSDPDVAELTAEAKLLYVWTWTNPRCNMSGAYQVTKTLMQAETGLTDDQVAGAFAELEEGRFAFYDGRVLWVRSRVKRLRQKTPNIAKSIAAHLLKLPKGHPYLAMFLTEYKDSGWLRESFEHGSVEGHATVADSRKNTDVSLFSSTVDRVSPDTPRDGLGLGELEGGPGETDTAAVERRLFAYWQQRCNHPTAKFTKERRSAIRARLREGYTEEQVRQAIDGAAALPFVNEQGKRFDDLTLVCRNGSKLEDFMGRVSSPGASKGSAALEERARRATPVLDDGPPSLRVVA